MLLELSLLRENSECVRCACKRTNKRPICPNTVEIVFIFADNATCVERCNILAPGITNNPRPGAIAPLLIPRKQWETNQLVSRGFDYCRSGGRGARQTQFSPWKISDIIAEYRIGETKLLKIARSVTKFFNRESITKLSDIIRTSFCDRYNTIKNIAWVIVFQTYRQLQFSQRKKQREREREKRESLKMIRLPFSRMISSPSNVDVVDIALRYRVKISRWPM